MMLEGTTGPLASLLKNSCFGCHRGNNTASSVALTGDLDAPYVWGDALPTYNSTGTGAAATTLAGGDFWWVDAGTDAAGHNVLGIAGADGAHSNTPPGGTALASQLTCAGATGCHGNRSDTVNDYSAMSGTHHNAAGASAASGYRYLDGIEGGEDAEWEWQADTSNHNVYRGVARSVDDDTIPAISISDLCEFCHGNFHNDDAGGGDTGVAGTSFASPWIRHPVDYAMPVAGDYDDYNTYSVIAPVGVTNIDGGYSFDTATNDRIITCITCHRAHGTPYPGLMRWDYKSWPGGANNDGCQICHTSKN